MRGDQLADNFDPTDTKMGHMLEGTGTFRDTGRRSSGYAESMDSLIGAPARTLIDQALKGNISMNGLQRVFHQIGADPETAPTGKEIVAQYSKYPDIQDLLGRAIDMGAQLPGTEYITPGVVGEIRGVKDMGKVADAVEAFAARGKAPISTEAKIAQMHGSDVADAMPQLIDRAKSEMTMSGRKHLATDEPRAPDKNTGEDMFWHDVNDHSFSDHAKEQLDGIMNRGKISEDSLKLANSAPHNIPYVQNRNDPFPVPNYSTQATGLIGENRIQGSGVTDANRIITPDPFSWMDDKYKAGKELLQKHSREDIPAEIHTSSDLIARPDYIKEIPEGSTVHMHFLSGDPTIDRMIFPGNTSQKRLESAATALEQAGIKVNRIYPDSGQVLVDQSKKAYGPNILQRAGFGNEDALASKLNDTLQQRGSLRQTIPIKPDNYAHGGTVVPHYATGGMAGLPPGFTLDQQQPQQNTGGLPPGFQLDDDKYGGASGMAASAAMGAARGVTLGASDMLFNPETVRGYQETNPKSAAAGEIGGVIASALSGEEASPLSYIGKLGKATVEGVKGLEALKIADQTTKVGKILGAVTDVGAHSAGSAVEGALYTGIGSSLNEYALGDPSLNGEKIAANFGTGAILGGALGGALKTAEIGVPEAVTAAKNAIVGARDYLIGSGGGGESGVISNALRSMGSDNSTAVKLADAIDNRVVNLTPEESTGVVKKITGTMSSVYKNIETSLKKLNDTIRPAERDALINTATDPEKLAIARQGIIDKMNLALKTAEERPALFDPGPVAKLEQIRDDFVGQLKNIDPASVHEDMIKAKQQLQVLDYSTTSSTVKDTKDLLQGVWGHIRDVTHDPNIFGEAGSAQAGHDAMLAEHYQFTPPNDKSTPFRKAFMEKTAPGKWEVSAQKVETALKQKGTTRGDAKLDLLDKWWEHIQKLPEHLENTFANVPNDLWDENKFASMRGILGKAEMSTNEAADRYVTSAQNMKGKNIGMKDMLTIGIGLSHPVIGAAIEAFNVVQHPLEQINKLAALERMVGKVTNAIGSGVKSIFENTETFRNVSRLVSTRYAADERVKSHQEMQKQFAQFSADPNKLADQLGDATQKLYAAAPSTGQALQMTTAKAVQFLQSKLPSKPDSNEFQEPYIPSDTEMSKFERYLNVIEKPTIALEQVKNRTIGPETIEALSAVYPKLLDQMRQSVQLEASKVNAKGPIPFQLKMAISQFLGAPLSPSLNFMNVMNNQMAFQQAQQASQQKQEGAQKISKNNVKDMKAHSRISLNPSANEDA